MALRQNRFELHFSALCDKLYNYQLQLALKAGSQHNISDSHSPVQEDG